jgi:hypothetical protein
LFSLVQEPRRGVIGNRKTPHFPEVNAKGAPGCKMPAARQCSTIASSSRDAAAKRAKKLNNR